MTNTLAWHQDLDNSADDYSTGELTTASTAWQLWSLLIAAGWSVVGTCDSSTAGLDGPGTNRFGTSWDAAKWVRAAPASPHSWGVLRHPVSLVYCCIDLSGSTAAQGIKAWFAMAGYTGGTTTAKPTSGDEWQAYSTAAINDGAALTRCNLLYADEGDFLFFTVKTGVGNEWYCLGLFSPTNALDNDAYPAFSYCFGAAAGGMAPINWHNPAYWSGRTGGGTLFGTAPYAAPFAPFMYGAASYALAGIPGGGGQRSGTWPRIPCWMWLYGSLTGDVKGTIDDIDLAVHALPIGTPYKEEGLITKVKIGCVWLPLTAQPTL